MKQIELPLFDLSKDRIREAISHYVQLEPEYMTYNVEVHVYEAVNVKEEQYEEKDEYICYDGTVRRSSITAVDIDYTPSSEEQYDYWVVEPHVYGMVTRLRIKFETQKQARLFFDELRQWWKTGEVQEPVKE